MDDCFGISDIRALQELINPKDHLNSDDDEDDLPQAGARKLGPGDVAGCSKETAHNYSGPHSSLRSDKSDDIWQPSEIKFQANENLDPREVPEYEMKFKQSVSAEDVFLGMGFKTPSTSSCEWLVVSVKLPSENRENIELSVESDAIDIRSPRYRLHLQMPHPVDPNGSSAKWQSEVATLEICLKLRRELDLINF